MNIFQDYQSLRDLMRALLIVDLHEAGCGAAGGTFVVNRFDVMFSDEAISAMVAEGRQLDGTGSSAVALNRIMFAELRCMWTQLALAMEKPEQLQALQHALPPRSATH